MITILIAAHQQRQRTAIQAIAAFANVLINLLVVNRFGITGVAAVYAVSEFILLLGYFLLFHRWQQKYKVELLSASSVP